MGTPAEWDAFGSESCVSSENTKRGSGGSNSVLHPRNHHPYQKEKANSGAVRLQLG